MSPFEKSMSQEADQTLRASGSTDSMKLQTSPPIPSSPTGFSDSTKLSSSPLTMKPTFVSPTPPTLSLRTPNLNTNAAATTSLPVVTFPPYIVHTLPPVMNALDDQAESGAEERALLLDQEESPKINFGLSVFVSGLPQGLTEDMLRSSLIQSLSRVISNGSQPLVIIRRDRMSGIFAYVQLQSREEVAAVLAQANEFDLEGIRPRIEPVHVNRTLYLARFPRLSTVQHLKELLENYLPVESILLCKQQEINTTLRRPKRAAFVTYQTQQLAEQAYEILSTTYQDWVVSWTMPASDAPTPNTDTFTLFVGGLNRKLVTKDLLKERFQQYGNVVAVDLILNENDERNRSAFAFVRFAESYSAPHAIEAENSCEWLGKRIRVQFCEPPDLKQRRRSSQFAYPLLMRPTGAVEQPPVPQYFMPVMPVEYPVGAMQANLSANPYIQQPLPAEALSNYGYPGFEYNPSGYVPTMHIPGQPYAWHMAPPNFMMAYRRPSGGSNPQHFVIYPQATIPIAQASPFGMLTDEPDIRALQEGIQSVRLH